MIPSTMVPQRKVTAGVIAAAILYTILRVAEIVTGKPVPLTADDAVIMQTVLVFLIQWMVGNKDQLPAE